jgi:hypothetical protein
MLESHSLRGGVGGVQVRSVWGKRGEIVADDGAKTGDCIAGIF